MSKTIFGNTGNSLFSLSIVFWGRFFVFYLTIEQKRLNFESDIDFSGQKDFLTFFWQSGKSEILTYTCSFKWISR